MSENTNQRKTITGASAAYRYAHIAGLSSLIITIPISVVFGFIGLWTILGMDCTSNCPPRITEMKLLLIFLPIYIVFSLIALLATAPVIRERYNFRYDQRALLKGGAHFFVWILIPAYVFRQMDTSPYHSVSTGAYLLLIILYYCVGYFAFRGKTASTSL